MSGKPTRARAELLKKREVGRPNAQLLSKPRLARRDQPQSCGVSKSQAEDACRLHPQEHMLSGGVWVQGPKASFGLGMRLADIIALQLLNRSNLLVCLP